MSEFKQVKNFIWNFISSKCRKEYKMKWRRVLIWNTQTMSTLYHVKLAICVNMNWIDRYNLQQDQSCTRVDTSCYSINDSYCVDVFMSFNCSKISKNRAINISTGVLIRHSRVSMKTQKIQTPEFLHIHIWTMRKYTKYVWNTIVSALKNYSFSFYQNSSLHCTF